MDCDWVVQIRLLDPIVGARSRDKWLTFYTRAAKES